jgi:2-oxoglutarate ferredoxin oxidoreductase subunit alpha
MPERTKWACSHLNPGHDLMAHREVHELKSVTIRFAGDSGDGMQLTGNRFTDTAALIGNDVATFPDYPAEIRAPAGSLPGVSGFQVQFSSRDIYTPGDAPDVLVAMNPAALKRNLKDLVPGGVVFVNEDAFTKSNLKLAGYEVSPLEDETLTDYRVFKVPMSSITLETVKPLGMGKKEGERCKNFFALGLLYFVYDRPLDATLAWIEGKFGKTPALVEANTSALKAGYNYGDTIEAFQTAYKVKKAKLDPGTYRSMSGNLATAYGMMVAADKAGRTLFYGSYPITPASDILHELSRHREFGVKTFQAEDEIAAMGATIGAAFAGAVAVTGTSGPGVALKTEAIGLAVMTELPMVIVNVQRGGPSTGLPTKTEQADLFQAVLGRNGEAPLPVLAPRSPDDCFDVAIEAVRIAIRYRTPVIMLSDGYIANGAEPWLIPDLDAIEPIEMNLLTREQLGDEPHLPYKRDEQTLARNWAIAGEPGLQHRVGGLEKDYLTGNVSYDPENHERMIKVRAEKVQRVAQDYAPLKVEGPDSGPLLILGWGSTYGAITSAGEKMREEGIPVANLSIRHLFPFHRGLEATLRRYDKVLVPELNNGQLTFLLRAQYLMEVESMTKIQGLPFKVAEIIEKSKQLLSTEKAH